MFTKHFTRKAVVLHVSAVRFYIRCNYVDAPCESMFKKETKNRRCAEIKVYKLDATERQ